MLADTELAAQLDGYHWYHKIPVTPGYKTPGSLNLDSSWAFMQKCILDSVPLAGKSVLDVGCRDGLLSFFAEQNGAEVVTAIDNDINPGSKVLAGILESKVTFEQCNLFDYAPVKPYDIVFCFGVVYHLRYPFNGLAKLLQFTDQVGTLCIETALYRENKLPLLYCPYQDSPYEGTSVSFFNELALARAMESFGAKLLSVVYQPDDHTPLVQRAFCVCKNGQNTPTNHLRNYWNGTHRYHSTGSV